MHNICVPCLAAFHIEHDNYSNSYTGTSTVLIMNVVERWDDKILFVAWVFCNYDITFEQFGTYKISCSPAFCWLNLINFDPNHLVVRRLIYSVT